MSDIRARRTAVLAAAAKAKSEAKAHAADQGIRRLVKRGEPVTFQAVQREAGVSHAFLYGNPDLPSTAIPICAPGSSACAASPARSRSRPATATATTRSSRP
jgi:uncharacterized protein DUF6262